MICARCKADLGKPEPGWTKCRRCGLGRFVASAKKGKPKAEKEE